MKTKCKNRRPPRSELLAFLSLQLPPPPREDDDVRLFLSEDEAPPPGPDWERRGMLVLLGVVVLGLLYLPAVEPRDGDDLRGRVLARIGELERQGWPPPDWDAERLREVRNECGRAAAADRRDRVDGWARVALVNRRLEQLGESP